MKWLALLVLFIALLSYANAAVISETTFSDLGYTDYLLVFGEGGAKGCTSYLFVEEKDLNGMEYMVFSLHAAFSPVQEGGADLNVYFNDSAEPVARANPEDFVEGWLRVELPREMVEEKNSLSVCAKTSHTVTGISLFNDSKVGVYLKPDFSAEDSFLKTSDNLSPKIGKEFNISVRLRNYGSEAVEVGLRFRRKPIDDWMPDIQVIKGDLSQTGTISACVERDSGQNCIIPGEMEFGYVVKATRAVRMRMLPAIVEYENIFGEKVVRESNRLELTAIQPEIRLKPFLLVEKELLKPGQRTRLTLGVKNEGIDELFNIDAALLLGDGLSLEGNKRQNIEAIMPGETQYLDFQVFSENPGEFEIGCALNYLDYNAVSTSCESISLAVEGFELTPALAIGFVLLAIGIIVYIYIVKR